MGFKQNYNGVDPNGEEVKSRDFLPEEIFAAKVEKAYEKVTKTENRYPMVNIMLRITEEGNHHGKVIWDNIVFCESMKGRNKHLLKVLEQPYEGEVDIEPGEWLNQDLKIKIKHEPYKGKSVCKISQYLYKDESLGEESEEHVESTRSEKSENSQEDDEIPF